MTYGALEAIQRARDEYFVFQLHKCAMCREPIETETYYVIERFRYCPQCAMKWLERHKHRNERL